MKRTGKIFILAIILFSVIFSNNIVKAQDAYGEVTNLSDAEVDIEGSETANVNLKYNRLNLVWYKADPSIGRTVDGYWVGYRVDFPESLGGASAEQSVVEKAQYRGKFTGYEWSENKSFYNARDGKWFMTGWVQITQNMLDANEGEFDLFEVEFDWDGNGTFEQNIKIQINSKNVVLDPSNVTTVTIKESGNGASDEVRRFLIETGKSLNEGLIQSELDILENIRNEEGFVKFYKEGVEDEEFSFDETIDETEITIIALFDKQTITPEPDEPTPTPEPDEPTPTPEPGEPTVTPEPEKTTPTPEPGGTVITPEKSNVVKDETPKTGFAKKINYTVIVAALVVFSISIIILRKKNNK